MGPQRQRIPCPGRMMGYPWTIYGPGSYPIEIPPSVRLRVAMQNLAACIQAAAIEEMRLQMAVDRMTRKP